MKKTNKKDLEENLRRVNKSNFYIPFVIMAFIVVFLIFNDGGIIGFAGLDVEKVIEGPVQVVEEEVVEETVIEEPAEEVVEELKREGTYADIVYYSCAPVDGKYEICVDVEWNDGDYAKGYIVGGKALPQIDKEYESPFTYCQTLENGGTRALHAYLYAENGKVLFRDIGKRVRCGD